MQTELHLVKLYAIRYNMVKRTFWLKLVNKYWKEKQKTQVWKTLKNKHLRMKNKKMNKT